MPNYYLGRPKWKTVANLGDFHIYRYIVRQMNLSCTECREFCTTTSADTNSLEYALIAVKDRGGLVYPSEEIISLIRLCDRRYREVGSEVETVKEKELHRYVLENSYGMPDSICEHPAATQYGKSNHYYNLVVDIVKIFHKIWNFEVVRRRNIKIHQKLVRHNNIKLTKVWGQ